MYIHSSDAIRLERGETQAQPDSARFDFVDAPRVFEGPTFAYEDDRLAYSERRFVTLGILDGIIVSVVHTETPRMIRVISLRKATRHERAIFFKSI